MEERRIIRKKANPIAEWGYIGDKFYYEEFNGRAVRNVVIGEIEYAEGDPDYIVEPMFTDIADVALQDKNYKIYVDIYSEPMVVITLKDQLIMHNAKMPYLKALLKSVMDEMEPELQLNALTEIINNHKYQSKLGNAIKLLRDYITNALHKNINITYIECYLKDNITSITMPKTKLEEKMADMSERELAALYKKFLVRKITGKLEENQTIDSLLKIAAEQDKAETTPLSKEFDEKKEISKSKYIEILENTLTNEISLRTFMGRM